MEAKPRKVLFCHADNGTIPLQDWLYGQGVSDSARGRIEARIDRVEDGNLGDVEPVGEGVSELKMDFGPGYRIYFGTKGLEVHLIRGGTKATQAADIAVAKAFWRKHG